MHVAVGPSWSIKLFLLLLICQLAIWNPELAVELVLQQEHSLHGEVIGVFDEANVRDGELLRKVKFKLDALVQGVLIKVENLVDFMRLGGQLDYLFLLVLTKLHWIAYNS